MPEFATVAGNRAALPARFYWLDFFRFLAAMIVVLHHYYLFYRTGSALPDGEADMIARLPAEWLAFFYAHGQLAVPFFWVLSGFVFAHTYFGRPADAESYAVARFARLYPLHAATLLAVAGLQIISIQVSGISQVIGNNDPYHFMLQVFLVSAWGFTAGDSFNAPIWSVSAEIGAYALFFVIHRIGALRTVAGQILLIILVISLSGGPVGDTVMLCAAFFFGGCATYILVAQRRAADFTAVAMLALFALLFPDALALRDLPLTSWLPVFMGVVFLGAWLDLKIPRIGARIGPLGDITYSVYLLHVPLIIAVAVLLAAAGIEERAFLSNPAWLVAYLTGVLGLSVLCHRHFELPVNKAIRAAFLRRRAMAKKVNRSQFAPAS